MAAKKGGGGVAVTVQTRLLISGDDMSETEIDVDEHGDLYISQDRSDCVAFDYEAWLVLKDAVDRLFAEHQKREGAQEG